ncbi:MAG: tetratricopeptide repeat protein [Magnetococcales bacterium]|nr:tetratricopeptide repeat protein [Magnetococcales bacterium]
MNENNPANLTIDEAYAQALDHFSALRFTEADKLCTAIIKIAPNHLNAINLLGVIAQNKDLHDLAVDLFLRAEQIDNSQAWLYYNIGISLHKLGRQEDALKALTKAISLKPTYYEAHNVLGLTLKEQGKLDKAVATFHKAIKIKPNSEIAQYNLGITLFTQNKLDEAIISFKNVITINPEYIEAYNYIAAAHHKKGALKDAVSIYKKALNLQPNSANICNNLGYSLKELGKLDDAIKCYKKSIALNPDNADAYFNLGNAYYKQDKLDKAEECYQKAIAINPNFAKAYSGYGDLLQSLGKIKEAIAQYKKALSIRPDFVNTHDSLIFCIDMISDVKIDLSHLERKKWAEIHAKPLQACWPTHSNPPDPIKKLRIGYVGADFKKHSAAHIFGPMLLSYNIDKFQVYCYAGNRVEDDLTFKFKEKSTKWVSTVAMDDLTLVEQINKDKIDILIDLSGHTVGNRLLVFARKPAPIQISAWGYPKGTGMVAMDYLIADPIFLPLSLRHKYCEEVIDLTCFIHLHSDTLLPEVSPPPVCKNGYITFGGFNRILKYNNDVYKLWSDILHKIPTAKLFLKTRELDNKEAVEIIKATFLKLGIASERLILIGTTSRQDHLKAHSQIDIMLDPFPHNGGTTTLESLRMGVPLLSCENVSVGPTGASLLHVLGLDEWRAKSEADYTDLAVKFANDIAMLKTLRRELRSRFDNSVLGNSQLYVEEVEKVYIKLWKKWCESR